METLGWIIIAWAIGALMGAYFAPNRQTNKENGNAEEH